MMCNPGEIYSFESGFCETLISYSVKFYQLNDNDVSILKNSPETEYNRDWAMDLWLRYSFSDDDTQTKIPILNSDYSC